MVIIGLTGGIGSGKSTVCEYFAALGTPIIDADKIAHQLVMKDKPALATIQAEFGGDTILDAQGNLDRTKIRSIVFNNPLLKEKLESILHPLIYEEIKNQINILKNNPQTQSHYCIVAIPLLIEKFAMFGQLIDRVVVVDLPENLQLARLQQREHNSKIAISEALAIIDSQAPRETRLAIADEVISNTSNLEQLKKNVNRLHMIWNTA